MTEGRLPVPRDEMLALLRLRALPAIGPIRLDRLLARWGSAGRALEAASDEELGRAAARERHARRHVDRAERSLAWLERSDVAVVVRGAPRYPPVLEQLRDPPRLLYLRGRRELLDPTAVAIVGSRRCTEYGADAAHALAAGLARAGVVVVSGLARGIDARAHEGALSVGGTSTIAVLASGVDVPCPPENERLQQRISEEGLLVTEFDPGTPGMGFHFPMRNRIVACLARGVVVVEAPHKSGAMITVRHAIDLGREVFAVPGPIGRPTSEGTNNLLLEGAGPVTCVRDILDVMNGVRGERSPHPARIDARLAPAPPPEPGGGTVGESDPALTLLRGGPLHLDDLARELALTPAEAATRLLALEIDGSVRQLPGLRFACVRPEPPAGQAGRPRT